uniref:Calmodulin n=1 Tax=Amphora coffeiformis TaxID=265554 RepID=A0A7S3L5P2_9STRA|mmetsp:Transcript_10374/g.19921  ORF Transcript_10374/g.19921 Transcript_10374/m.19921 type:complete len:116 (+) Transcript_10374:150-497(+)|eukprot:scaffold3195_cov162-Amphora_coffeaeformis.AAC.3
MFSWRLPQVLRQSRSLQTSLSRTFSSDCAPAQKLREVFEDYRQTHFSRETPARFKKEIVNAVESEGVVEKDSLNEILINIGRKDRLLSEEEYQTLCKEAGDESILSVSNMMKLIK